jgi:hypothetical protein
MAIHITIPTPTIKLPKLRRPKKMKRRTKLLTIMIVLVVLGGGGWFMYLKTLTGPAVGTVVMTMAATEKKPQVELEQFDGTNISFVHPMNFVEQSTKAQTNLTDIEHHNFLSTGMTGQYLTVVITKFAGSSLNDDSSYSMRIQDPKRYQRKTTVVKNEQVTVFSSDDGQQFGQVAFWQHGDKLLTMSLTGIAGDNQTTINEFNAMVGSVVWH